jgi:hypothetical protein
MLLLLLLLLRAHGGAAAVAATKKEGAALRGLGGPLRYWALVALRRQLCVAPWLPHARLADGKRGLSHELAPARAVLR